MAQRSFRAFGRKHVEPNADHIRKNVRLFAEDALHRAAVLDSARRPDRVRDFSR
jgi:hypothetical protein